MPRRSTSPSRPPGRSRWWWSGAYCPASRRGARNTTSSPESGRRAMKLLITTDGSDASLAAVRYAVKTAPECRGLELHVITVQPPIPSTANVLVGRPAVKDYQREQGEACLARARALLDAAGLPYESHVLVG